MLLKDPQLLLLRFLLLVIRLYYFYILSAMRKFPFFYSFHLTFSHNINNPMNLQNFKLLLLLFLVALPPFQIAEFVVSRIKFCHLFSSVLICTFPAVRMTIKEPSQCCPFKLLSLWFQGLNSVSCSC